MKADRCSESHRHSARWRQGGLTVCVGLVSSLALVAVLALSARPAHAGHALGSRATEGVVTAPRRLTAGTIIQAGGRNVLAQYVPRADETNSLFAASFTKSLSALASSPHVEPDGPTVGPNGIEIPYELPPCTLPNGKPGEVHVFLDYKDVLIVYGLGLTGYTNDSFDGIYLYEEPSVGTHQLSFACYPFESPEPGTIFLGGGQEWSAPATWKDDGFQIEVTGRSEPVWLSTHVSGPGYLVTTTSGAPDGPHPCPTVPGGPWTAVHLSLYVASFDYNVPSAFVYEERFALAGSTATSWPVPIPANMEPNSEVFVTVECAHLTSGPRAFEARFLYNWDERYDESLIRLTAPVGGTLASWETYGGRNPAESSCTCAEGWTGDPVNTATGEYSETTTDATVESVGEPLHATRTYSSGRHAIDSPFGYGWSSAYMPRLEASKGGVIVTQESGAEVRYEAREGKYVAPPRVNATLVRNEDGSYIFMTREPGHYLVYDFDEVGRLQSITEPDGVATTLAYPDAVKIIVTKAGRALTYNLTGSHVSSVVNPAGDETSYEYDAEGNLVKVTDPLGRTTAYTYDGSHQMLTRVDARGGKTENIYSPAGQVEQQSDPMGRTTTYAYEPEPGVTVVTSPTGIATRYAYEYGLMTSRIVGWDGNESADWSYAYDPVSGGTEAVYDPAGLSVSRTFDAQGRVLSRRVGNNTTKYTYDSLGDVLTETDALGTKTTYEYDSGGELLSKTTPLGEGLPMVTSHWEYGSGSQAGELLASTDPIGHTTHYSYNVFGDPMSVTDPLGHETTMSYDPDGLLLTTTAPNGNVTGGDAAAHTTTREYDAAGELVTVTDGLGGVTRYGYNEDGQQTSVVDPSARSTTYVYDLGGDRVSVKRGEEPASKATYNAEGQIVTREDAGGRVTTFQYSDLGYRTAVTVNGSTTRTTYDRDGKPTEVQLPTGDRTYYEYNEEGRLRFLGYSDSTTPYVENTYDAAGRRTAQRTDSTTSHSAYDALDRLTSETDGSGRTTGYEYDAAGNLTAITYPNGKTVRHTYDAANNLTQIEDWLGHKTEYKYDADGNREQEILPGGITSTGTYNADDSLTEMTDASDEGSLASFNYERDKAGRLNTANVTGALTTAATYGYDEAGRLEHEGENSLTYDPSGNATGYVGGSTQHFNAANELMSSNAPRLPIVEPPEPPREEPQPPGEEHGAHEPPPEFREEHNETRYEAPQWIYKGSGDQTVTTATGGVLSEKAATPRVTGESSSHATSVHGQLTVRVPAVKVGSLVIAFLSAPANSSHVDVVGRGLRWHTLSSGRSHGSSVVIATARATRALAADKATAHGLAVDGSALLTVVTFAPGAQLDGARSANGSTGPPRVTVTAHAGALVWAVGHDSKHTAARPVGATLTSRLDQTDGSSWVQRQTAKGSGPVRIADTAPTAGSWVLAGVAVGASPAAAARARSSTHPGSTHTTAMPTTNTPTPSPVRPSPATTKAASRNSDAGAATESVGPTRTFSYVAGNRVDETVEGKETHFSYDQAGRLVTVGRLATYTYDGDGLRTSKTMDGTTTEYTWQHAETLPMLLQAGDTYYIYGPTGAPVEQITAETPTYLLQDEQGSTRLLTNAEGKLAGTYSYDAWGNTTAHTGTSSGIQYAGQYVDEETGYEYLRGRYYDPSTGQFLTPDPGYATTLARYGYAEDDPPNASDPSGLFCVIGHDPNGACRGSNLGNDVHAIGTGAAVTGIVAGVVIVSVGTGGIADEVAADAAIVGLAADGVGAYNACASAPDPWSRQCAGGIGQVALDYGTFHLGQGLRGAAAGYYGVAMGVGSYGYSQWVAGPPGGGGHGGNGVVSYCRGVSAVTQPTYGQLMWQSSDGSYLEP